MHPERVCTIRPSALWEHPCLCTRDTRTTHPGFVRVSERTPLQIVVWSVPGIWSTVYSYLFLPSVYSACVLLVIIPYRYTQRASSLAVTNAGIFNVSFLTEPCRYIQHRQYSIIDHVGIHIVTAFHYSSMSVYSARARSGTKVCRYTQRGFSSVVKPSLLLIQQFFQKKLAEIPLSL